MKAGLFLTGLTLVASASAAIHHGHRHMHKREPEKAPAYQPPKEAPAVILYVDSKGHPVTTVTKGHRITEATPYPAPPAKQPAVSHPPPKQTQPKPKEKEHKHSSGSGVIGSGSGHGQGITYTPYNADNSCKSAEQVKSDVAQLGGYALIRIYGVDCNQVANVLAASKVPLLVGIFDPIGKLQEEVESLIKQVNGQWNRIDTVSIGNELVNGGKASVAQVTGAIQVARGLLKKAGYNGNVITIDTFVAIIANPGLCHASDYAAANCHAFFDGGKTADQAGDFVKDQAQRIKEACGGKRVVITESGWPSQGEANGVAVPSKENQQKAIASIKANFEIDIFVYSAFNDLWKNDFGGSHGCEKYWGILSH